MNKKVLIVILITIFARFFGFFREIVLSYFFGLSDVTDAFIISLTIPSVLFLIIGEGINKTLVPIYAEVEAKESSESANIFLNQLNLMLYLLSALVIIITLVFTEPIITILAHGFSGEQLELTVKLTRISVFSIFFITSTYLLIGYLQIKEKYIIISMVGIPLNLVNIITVVISSKLGIDYLAYGQIIAALVQLLLVLFFFSKKSGYSFKLSFKEKIYLRKISFNAIPVMLGKSVHQVNKMVDKTIASTIFIGGISALTYANRINLLIQNIFITPLSMIMYTELSKRTANGDHEISEFLQGYVIQTLIIILPIVSGGFLLSEEIISLIYGRGAFGAEAIEITANIFKVYLVGAIAFSFRNLLTNVFFAIQDTRTPMFNSVISLTLNIFLNLIFSHLWGIYGIALATTVSITLASALFYRSCIKIHIVVFDSKMLIKLLKLTVASVVMVIILMLVNHLFISLYSNLVIVAMNLIGGIALYVALLYLMKVEELRYLIKQLLKRYGKMMKKGY